MWYVGSESTPIIFQITPVSYDTSYNVLIESGNYPVLSSFSMICSYILRLTLASNSCKLPARRGTEMNFSRSSNLLHNMLTLTTKWLTKLFFHCSNFSQPFASAYSFFTKLLALRHT